MDRRKKGHHYENVVVSYLEREGFKILERNYYTRFGEIDIVAEKLGTIYFVEVRGSSGAIDPLESVNWRKIKHLLMAIRVYLKERRVKLPYRTILAVVRTGGELDSSVELYFDFIEN